MDDLKWLVEHRFKEAIRYEYSWDFIFDGGAAIATECLWRLLESGRIRLTSEDNGQRFGMPNAIDAVLDVNRALAGANVLSVTLADTTLDLEIRFGTGHVLQVIPDSSGYEAWNARKPGWQCVAQGGGNLCVFNDDMPDSQIPTTD
jgi:hypothetical protein